MKFIKKSIKIFMFFLCFLAITYLVIFIYAKVSKKLPIKSANNFYLYDNSDNLYSGNDNWISLDNMSNYIKEATISIEDKNFYKHNGFDILRIFKALFTNISSGKTKQGASTITQQYAKNLFLTFDKTWTRKFEEALLTFRLEAHYKKNDILEGYLNTINYGGVFGIENASNYYFGKSSKDLTLAEASIIAGIPKSPNNYSPISNFKNAKKRQKLILESMVKNNYISKKQMDEAYNEELTFKGSLDENNSSLIKYFEDAVMKELKSIYSIPPSFLDTGGLKIYTTLDMDSLNNLEEKIKNNITDEDLQIAAVLMDPKNGEIKAIAGGKDYSKSEFNRVTDSKRQMGSSIKPLLYYSALENGFTASSTFTSEKTTFNLGNNKTYSPKNYNDIYANKPISMSAAISYSDNIYAVKTHIFLGEETLVDTLKRLGITSKASPIASLALGTLEINILEMMKAYSTFANEGYSIKPHFIKKVLDQSGNVLYEYKNEENNILNKSTVFILNELLTSCYDKNLLDYNTPTCLSIVPKMRHKYSIKTGTTDTDHLIFGYNKDAILGIWMGYDDNRNTEVSTGNVMKNIWIDTMEEYLLDKEDNWYTPPNNVIGVLTNPITGELAKETDTKTKILYYIKGTQPYNENKEDSIPTIKTN